MKLSRTLYRIYNNGSIRQYPLSDNEWRDLIRKDPIKGWQSAYWHGIVIVHHGQTPRRKAWTWVAVVSSSGWEPGPTLPDLERILQMFRDSQEARQ